MPEDESLREDYLAFGRLYTGMAESLLLPEVADYAFEDIKNWQTELQLAQRREFQPHPQLKRKVGRSLGHRAVKRYSKRSDKVGRLGEERVYKDEVALLETANRPDLAARVIWHRQEKNNRTPGWDITSFTPDGKRKLIEVKASEGSIHSLTLTPNEWKQAENNRKTDAYYIYVVENLMKDVTIIELKNPAKYVEDGILEIKISEYELSLRHKG